MHDIGTGAGEAAELLSDEEAETLLRAILRERGVCGAAPGELSALLEWAREVRLSSILLEAVLAGDLGLDWKRGAARFTTRGGAGD